MMIYLSKILSINNDVCFYTFKTNKQIVSKTETEFKIKTFSNIKIISILRIAYSLRKYEYVFIWNSPMHFVWVISKILFRSKVKLIWWHHHYPWYYSKNANVYIKLKKIIERYFVKYIDLMVVNSNYLQTSIKKIYNVNSMVLYPIIDKEFLEYKKETIKAQKEKVIFTCSRWVEGKNIELIFKTYNKLKQKFPDLVLKIAWEGPDLEKQKSKYKYRQNNYKYKIDFLWELTKKQIIENLEKSSLFLFPSKVDSFWIVLLESMSTYTPVISYNLGWAWEIIKTWINWYLVNSDKEFIEKTSYLLDNNDLLKSFWKEAKKTSSLFSEESFKQNLLKILTYIEIN